MHASASLWSTLRQQPLCKSFDDHSMRGTNACLGSILLHSRHSHGRSTNLIRVQDEVRRCCRDEGEPRLATVGLLVY